MAFSVEDCWFLTGPTAAGKTEVALELARSEGAEIISLDSMAIYRGLDIGTAKPSSDERRLVPHHLIDLVDPEEEFSLACYVEEARRTADEIRSRGRQVLFVGGTGLYLKSLLRGIFKGPPADWELRNRWREETLRRGTPWLHEQLAAIDPLAARRLHPHDMRRMIRALEVYEKTGKPISDWQRQFDLALSAAACRVFVLDWPRDQLHQRINDRVEKMFTLGLVDEVRGLLARPAGLGHTARQALGYREVIEYLEGARDLAGTIELVKTRTRQFAKRQMTWFRGLAECRWISMSASHGPAKVARQIATTLAGER